MRTHFTATRVGMIPRHALNEVSPSEGTHSMHTSRLHRGSISSGTPNGEFSRASVMSGCAAIEEHVHGKAPSLALPLYKAVGLGG